MKCPSCGAINSTKVLESRDSGENIRRRRECECGARMTTIEAVVESIPGRLAEDFISSKVNKIISARFLLLHDRIEMLEEIAADIRSALPPKL